MSTYPRATWASLARAAARYPQSRFVDDLARLATRGAMNAESLLEHARGGAVGAASDFDPAGLAWFAHLRASQFESPERVTDTAHLFQLAYRIGGRRAFAPRLDTVWVQALALAGRLDEFRAVLHRSSAAEVAWWGAEADALHPGALTAESTEWLRVFNRPWQRAGLEPITFVDGAGTAFDRVTARLPADPSGDPEANDERGPLVTVVLPVFNPGPSLRTAVNSLVAQTWSRLEILICDDCSIRGLDVMAELAVQDPRVRVIRAQRNAGAYAARNLGIGAARGEYVTFNDADDWSHPRRIERQLDAVLGRPEAVASVSWSVRLSEDMALTVMGRIPERINLSSILFRRQSILEHLGGFDALRKGADSEFVSRLTSVLGADSLVELKEPLALVQLTAGSLSRDDYQFLRTHPARLQYMADLRHWHSLVAAEPELGYVPPGCRAPFPAAPYLSGAPAHDHRVDVVFLANLSDEAPSLVSLATEVTACLERGLSVALVEYLGPYDMTERAGLPSGALAELIRTSDVVRVLAGEPVHARLAVIRDPAAVHTMPEAVLRRITTDEVLIVADYSPAGGSAYRPAEVIDTLYRSWGSLPHRGCIWVPATPFIGSEVLADVQGTSGDSGAANDTPPAVTVSEPALCALPPADRPSPVAAHVKTMLRVGISPLGLAHQPITAVEGIMATLVPEQRGIEVLIYEPAKKASSQVRRSINSINSRTVTLQDFLQQVDVVIVGSAPGRGGHLDRTAVMAAALGKVLVLDAGYRGHFGDAGLYLDERSVTEWVGALREDVDLVRRARMSAHHFAQKTLPSHGIDKCVVRALSADKGGDE